jgi:hypothetical protein
MGLGTNLTSGNFTGNLSWLAPTTTIDPSIISGFFSGLQPSFQRMRQDTINTLAANNQLESSTTADALTQLDQNIADIMMGKVSGLQTQALQNRISLFGTGLDTLTTGTGMAQTNQNILNKFNLENYENQVAKALSGAKSGTPWGSIGSVVGGIGGFLIGGPAGASLGASLGGSIGGIAEGGSGGAASANSAMNLFGTALGSGVFNPSIGTTNNPFRAIPGSSATNSIGSASRYPYLFGNALLN